MGRENGTISLENSMVRSSKVKHVLRVPKSTSMFLSKRSENIHLPQDLYLVVSSSVICSNSKLETTHISINC